MLLVKKRRLLIFLVLFCAFVYLITKRFGTPISTDSVIQPCQAYAQSIILNCIKLYGTTCFYLEYLVENIDECSIFAAKRGALVVVYASSALHYTALTNSVITHGIFESLSIYPRQSTVALLKMGPQRQVHLLRSTLSLSSSPIPKNVFGIDCVLYELDGITPTQARQLLLFPNSTYTLYSGVSLDGKPHNQVTMIDAGMKYLIAEDQSALNPDCAVLYRIKPSKKCHRGDADYLCANEIGIAVLTSNNTWSRLSDGPFGLWYKEAVGMEINVFSPQLIPELPIAVPLGIQEIEDNFISEFSLASIVKRYEMNPGLKWYLKIDDDSYLFPSNLMELLADIDPSLPVIGGRIFYNPEANTTYMSGGAGYFLSNAIIRAIALDISACAIDGTIIRHPEDVLIFNCARKLFGSALKEFDIKTMNPDKGDGSESNVYSTTFHWIKNIGEASAFHNCRSFYSQPIPEV